MGVCKLGADVYDGSSLQLLTPCLPHTGHLDLRTVSAPNDVLDLLDVVPVSPNDLVLTVRVCVCVCVCM